MEQIVETILNTSELAEAEGSGMLSEHWTRAAGIPPARNPAWSDRPVLVSQLLNEIKDMRAGILPAAPPDGEPTSPISPPVCLLLVGLQFSIDGTPAQEVLNRWSDASRKLYDSERSRQKARDKRLRAASESAGGAGGGCDIPTDSGLPRFSSGATPEGGSKCARAAVEHGVYNDEDNTMDW